MRRSESTACGRPAALCLPPDWVLAGHGVPRTAAAGRVRRSVTPNRIARARPNALTYRQAENAAAVVIVGVDV